MNYLMRVAAPLLAMLVVLCAGCGGGGGGASAAPSRPGGGGGPVEVFTPISISLGAPGAIRDVTYEGAAPHMETIRINYAGDPNALSGRTVYVVVEMPDERLYLPPEPPFPVYGQRAVEIWLRGREDHGLPEGVHAGSMKIFACLDASCQTQLANSPLTLPYEIDVRPGLRVTPESLEMTTPYGVDLPVRTVSVTAPPGTDGWYVVPHDVPTDASPSSELLMRQWFVRPGPGNTMQFRAPSDVQAGRYAMDFMFDTVVPDLRYPDQPVRLVKIMRVSYTVTETGAYAITPASAEVTHSLGSMHGPSAAWPELASQRAGGTFSRRGIRTDAFPAAAAGHPLLASWLSYSATPFSSAAGFGLSACDLASRICLPPGTYRGALLLRHTAASGEHTDFEFPVQLTLTP